jgi:AcrR family transcriptional regulator
MARPRSDIQERIVHAARGRFLAEGVDGASLRSIADDAGTSVGMVGYYFPAKDDLFLAVVEEPYRQLLDHLERALAPGADVPERLRRLFKRVGQLTPDELQMVRLVAREALVSSSRLERLVQRFMRGHIPLVYGLIQEGVRDGTFSSAHHPVVLMIATFAMAGPAQIVGRQLGRAVPAAGAPGPEGLSEGLLALLMNGAAGSPARSRKRPRGKTVRE